MSKGFSLLYYNVRARPRFATINRKNISLVRAQNFPHVGAKTG